MDNFKDSSFNSFETFELQVTEAAKNHLRAAGGWGLFISIIGFIVLGLALLGSLIFVVGSSAIPEGTMPFNAGFMGVFMLIFNVLWAIPVVTLFRFSVKARNAVNDMSTEQLTQAMANLKYNLMFAGIMIIATMVFYLVATIMIISTAAKMGGHFN